ncbi:MAG: hypothetical protein ABW185_22910 [Sedimenticola sp.]
MELLRQTSRGLPRHAGRILKTAMQMAVPKGINHLPDELLQQPIEELRCMKRSRPSRNRCQMKLPATVKSSCNRVLMAGFLGRKKLADNC